jgi:hypothetical protein
LASFWKENGHEFSSEHRVRFASQSLPQGGMQMATSLREPRVVALREMRGKEMLQKVNFNESARRVRAPIEENHGRYSRHHSA